MAEFDLFGKGEESGINEEALEEINILDQHIENCFNTPSGAIVMAHLEEVIRQPAFDASLGLFNGIAQGFSREGQVALVTYLKNRAERARNQQ